MLSSGHIFFLVSVGLPGDHLTDMSLVLTSILVDVVDFLHVPCHRFDAGLFAAHLLEEQMVSLKIEHAGGLLRVDDHMAVVMAGLVIDPVRARVDGLDAVRLRLGVMKRVHVTPVAAVLMSNTAIHSIDTIRTTGDVLWRY